MHRKSCYGTLMSLGTFFSLLLFFKRKMVSFCRCLTKVATETSRQAAGMWPKTLGKHHSQLSIIQGLIRCRMEYPSPLLFYFLVVVPSYWPWFSLASLPDQGRWGRRREIRVPIVGTCKHLLNQISVSVSSEHLWISVSSVTTLNSGLTVMRVMTSPNI